MTAAQPAGYNPPRQIRIGIWGPTSSGKTTYLAALYVAIQRSELAGNWMMNGADHYAEEFLEQTTRRLVTDRRFETGTTDQGGMVFRFTGEEQRVQRSRFGVPKTESQRVAFELDVLDVPGRNFLGARGRPSISDDDSAREGRLGGLPGFDDGSDPAPDHDAQIERLLDHLQDCQGILFLYDPEADYDGQPERDSFENFYPILMKLSGRIMNQETHTGLKLPHHVAVCVTKFDQPNIYRKARLKGYTVHDETPPYAPRVRDDLAAEFFESLCRDPDTNAELVALGLRRNFSSVRYFVTSSIGFYVAEGRFRQHDCLNVERIGPGPENVRIRGRVRPINVLEPLLWLHDSIRRGQ